MLKVDPKTANLPTVQNFDVIEKMDAGLGISDLKLKVRLASDKVYFCCRPLLLIYFIELDDQALNDKNASFEKKNTF